MIDVVQVQHMGDLVDVVADVVQFEGALFQKNTHFVYWFELVGICRIDVDDGISNKFTDVRAGALSSPEIVMP